MTPFSTGLSLWKRIALILGILATIVTVLVGYALYVTVNVVIPESYCSWMTGDLLVRYLQIHTNQWPRNWDDLASVTNDPGPLSQYVAVENLRQTVKIDWQVDVRQCSRWPAATAMSPSAWSPVWMVHVSGRAGGRIPNPTPKSCAICRRPWGRMAACPGRC